MNFLSTQPHENRFNGPRNVTTHTAGICNADPNTKALFGRLDKFLNNSDSFKSIVQLKLKANFSSAWDFEQLDVLFGKLPLLNEISFVSTVSKTTAGRFITLLKRYPRIQRVWFHFYNDINVHSSFFLELLSIPFFTSIEFYTINLSDAKPEEIQKVLSTNKTLKNLSFMDSTIPEKVCFELAKYFATSEILEYFFMMQTKLEVDAIRAFADALATTKVKFLNLSGTNIGNTCACYFAQNLTTNRTIEGISLYDCGIGNEGAIELCKAIRFNPIINVFNISGNPFDEEAKKEIGTILPAMFTSNYNITRPNLDNLMMFCISSQMYMELLTIMQDYIDITLNVGQMEQKKEKEHN